MVGSQRSDKSHPEDRRKMSQLITDWGMCISIESVVSKRTEAIRAMLGLNRTPWGLFDPT